MEAEPFAERNGCRLQHFSPRIRAGLPAEGQFLPADQSSYHFRYNLR
jgi:hypothetical protein